MLYLEDFLELIEQLPGELRDRATEIRMLDLQAQQLHERANRERDEFYETGGSLPEDVKMKRYKEIMELYERAEALTDEKIAIAEVSHSLLLKYSQKLNKEILHFKLELEADNPGITEQIERKFNETERNLYLQRKERRRRFREGTIGIANMLNGNSGAQSDASSPCSRVQRGQLDESGEIGAELYAQSQQSGSRPSVSATAAAAGAHDEEARPNGGGNRARSTTAERDPDLPPLKVIVKRSLLNPHKIIGISSVHSSPAMHNQPSAGTPVDRGDGWNNTPIPAPSSSQVQFSLHPSKSTSSFAGTSTGTSGHSAPGPSMMSLAAHESRHGRPRKLTSRAQEMLYTMQRHERRAASHQSRSPEPMQAGDNDPENDKHIWCFCREKAYGAMVACDNCACPYEWFHYECVNVSEKPKGKWYCSLCAPKYAFTEMPTPSRL